MTVRGRRDQVELRVPGQQAQQLPAGIPTGPGHRDPDSHTHLRMTMQRTVSTHIPCGNHAVPGVTFPRPPHPSPHKSPSTIPKSPNYPAKRDRLALRGVKAGARHPLRTSQGRDAGSAREDRLVLRGVKQGARHP
ncbi:hypothetical protein Apa02nite_041390 [Actinoplanes palleronii]|uniref:Uncharacterized protein n=1 Tax=Actinoplanes palleronii TaxID=113570 RepID=A0ABQ4BBJ6_9ACTN|nr:hypothetical protein Apa02nite_041390 [Actinoplanes palleronii]